MKTLQLYFVQRSTYDLLVSKDFTTEDLLNIIKGNSGSKKISPITERLIHCIDSHVKSVLFNNFASVAISSNEYKYLKPLNDSELKYVTDEVNSYLLCDEDYASFNDSNDEKLKCYEIVTNSNTDTINLVIVVEKGFLSLVTTNPEKLTCFYRELIRHSFGHEAICFQLNREYLGLKMNPGYYDLVKLRADKRS